MSKMRLLIVSVSISVGCLMLAHQGDAQYNGEPVNPAAPQQQGQGQQWLGAQPPPQGQPPQQKQWSGSQVPQQQWPAGQVPQQQWPAGQVPQQQWPAGQTSQQQWPAGQTPQQQWPAGQVPQQQSPAGQSPQQGAAQQQLPPQPQPQRQQQQQPGAGQLPQQQQPAAQQQDPSTLTKEQQERQYWQRQQQQRQRQLEQLQQQQQQQRPAQAPYQPPTRPGAQPGRPAQGGPRGQQNRQRPRGQQVPNAQGNYPPQPQYPSQGSPGQQPPQQGAGQFPGGQGPVNPQGQPLPGQPLPGNGMTPAQQQMLQQYLQQQGQSIPPGATQEQLMQQYLQQQQGQQPPAGGPSQGPPQQGPQQPGQLDPAQEAMLQQYLQQTGQSLPEGVSKEALIQQYLQQQQQQQGQGQGQEQGQDRRPNRGQSLPDGPSQEELIDQLMAQQQGVPPEQAAMQKQLLQQFLEQGVQSPEQEAMKQQLMQQFMQQQGLSPEQQAKQQQITQQLMARRQNGARSGSEDTVGGEDESVATLTAITGSRVMLNCTVPPGGAGPVMWLAPGESVPVSSGDQVVDSLRDRVLITGDSNLGQFNLFIRDVTFPADNGTWTCSSFNGLRQRTRLVVLAPPALKVPDVSPSNVTVVDMDSEAWTFTCVAQFAHPPVDLTWVKVSGPDAEFKVTPPHFVASQTGTSSTSLKLVVSAANAGSAFACRAQHPAFGNQTYSRDVIYGQPRAEAMVQGEEATPAWQALSLSSMQMDNTDIAIVITMSTLLVVMAVVSCVLFKGRGKWELDVRLPNQYTKIPSDSTETANGSLLNGSAKPVDQKDGQSVPRRTRKACVLKMAFGMVFSCLLLLSLALSIPIYLKGITTPKLGTDSTTAVVAGSALWLDCSTFVTSTESMLGVTWRKDASSFFHQFLVSGDNVGKPDNSSLGLMMGFRVTSERVGQINIWPVLPDEEGVYSCEVTMMASDDGRTVVKRKTFGVFVITGIMLNTALLVLLSIAICSALGLILIGLVHSIKCITASKQAEADCSSVEA